MKIKINTEVNWNKNNNNNAVIVLVSLVSQNKIQIDMNSALFDSQFPLPKLQNIIVLQLLWWKIGIKGKGQSNSVELILTWIPL